MDQGAQLLNHAMQASKPAVGRVDLWRAFSYCCWSVEGTRGIEMEEGVCHCWRSPEHVPCALTWFLFYALNWHSLQLGTWNGFHCKPGLGASWIPASFLLGTEEDPTCSSRSLLRYYKRGASYLSETWEHRRRYFFEIRVGNTPIEKSTTESQGDHWSKAEFYC